MILKVTNPAGAGATGNVAITTYADTPGTKSIDAFAGTHFYNIQKAKL